MKWFLIIFLLINFEVSARCVSPPPQISVNSIIINPTINNNLGIRELTRLSAGALINPDPSKYQNALGLTEFGLAISVKNMSGFEINGRERCTVINKIDIELEIKTHVLYVAREALSNACLYKEIYDHEMTHVITNNFLVRKLEERLRAFLIENTKNGFSSRKEKAAASEELSNWLNTSMLYFIEQNKIDRHSAHSKIDTHDEYDRLSRVCNFAASELLRQSIGR